MAIAFNIFIFGSSPNLVADDCSECSSTTWTSEPSTTFNIGDCNFTINYESRQCDDSLGTNRELKISSIQKLNPACDTISSAQIYNRSLKYLLYTYYQTFDTLNYYDTTKVAFVSAPCLQEADMSGLIEFCSTTYCNRVEYNLTGFSEFTELVGTHTYTSNYMPPTMPCGAVMPCGTDMQFVYNIPPGPLHPQLYSNPTVGDDCSLNCFWKLNGNSNVDDYYNFIGPTNIGQDFIIKTNRGSGNDERIRIKNEGGIDFHVGAWDKYNPQIGFGGGYTSDPTIMFYRNSGDPGNLNDAYPFWIQESYGTTGGLRFMNESSTNFRALIGSENPVTRFKLNYNGNVGVNKEVPTARFQVTEGNVLFDGNTTSSYDDIPSGAGNRFMWVAEKSALRAGEVIGSQWNNSNIGTHSAAFGYNNIANGNYSLVSGYSNTVTGLSTLSSGSYNIVLGNHSAAFGYSNINNGVNSFIGGSSNYISEIENSIVYGLQNTNDGGLCQVFGESNFIYNNTSILNFVQGYYNVLEGTDNFMVGRKNYLEGNYNSIIGYGCSIVGDQSHANGRLVNINGNNSFGYGNEIDINGNNSFGIGNIIEVNSNNSFAFGTRVEILSSHNGSFVIGDNSLASSNKTPSTNMNQMTMRFTGDPEGKSTDEVFRFITLADIYGDPINYLYLDRDSYGFVTTSDRNKKKEIKDIDNKNILNKMRNVKIKSWKWQDVQYLKDSTLHLDNKRNTWLGPMAQDFHAQFSEFGNNDSTALPLNVVSSVMFSSIQALADIVDNHSLTLTSVNEKIDFIDNYTKELLTKLEFEEYKNKSKCLDSVCEKVSILESNYTNQLDINSTLLTKSEFNSFKDSISCYAGACKRIKDLEDTIDDLKKRLNDLESADTSGSGGPKYNQSIYFNSNDFENRVILEQNNPNPFENETKINYYIPSEIKGNAELMLTDEKGSTIIKKLEACIGKPCSITLSSDNLETGVYIYALLINGKIIKSQKMMIIK